MSSKEIHSKVFSKRWEGKFEDEKSLCSEVCLLSEHSAAEWNKCFNIAWKTNSSIQTMNWKLFDTFLSNEIAKQHHSQNKRYPEEAEMSLWGHLQTLITGFWYSFTHQMIWSVQFINYQTCTHIAKIQVLYSFNIQHTCKDFLK